MAGFAIAACRWSGSRRPAGFFSKFYLSWATVEAGNWVLAVVIVGSSLLTLVYFLRLFEQIFVTAPQEDVVRDAMEPSATIVGPVLVLAVAVVAVGLFNAAIVRLVLDPVAQALVG
jgi:multicomponent Na+:H+ antiporter subunit D